MHADTRKRDRESEGVSKVPDREAGKEIYLLEWCDGGGLRVGRRSI